MLNVGRGFPRKLRQLRQSNGWTQAELARRAEVRERQIIRWENSQNAPRFDHLVALARALGCTVGELSDDDEEEAASMPPTLSLLEQLYQELTDLRAKAGVA